MADPVSTKTNLKYAIPSDVNDKENLHEFISRNKGKKVVVVQGLGFVGAVMSLVVANAITEEYAVIGVDLPHENSYWKIKSINEGVFPIAASDDKINEFYQRARKKKNLYATFDPYAYSLADVIIIDINLDVNKVSEKDGTLVEYGVDLSPFTRALESVAKQCKADVLVLVETTVPPGTCEKVIVPIFNKEFRSRNLPQNYYLGHSYERVMPGPGYVDSIQNFYRVYSGIDDRSADRVEEFLKTIIYTNKFPLTRLHSTNASEMSKVLENSYRAMNIAFMSEWTAFAEESGVNLYEVLEAIRLRPTHKNIMSPGLGVGGYCLPKDPLLASWSRKQLFQGKGSLSQSEIAVSINDRMPQHTFNVIGKIIRNEFAGYKIGLIGVSYLNNVGDTRYSPAGILFDLMVNRGADVRFTDPFIPVWNEKNMYSDPMDHFIAWRPQLLVFCTGHECFRHDAQLHRYIKETPSVFVVDTINLLDSDTVDFLSAQKRICVIGRGDVMFDQNK